MYVCWKFGQVFVSRVVTYAHRHKNSNGKVFRSLGKSSNGLKYFKNTPLQVRVMHSNSCVNVRTCIWEHNFQIDHFILGLLLEQVYMFYSIKHIKLSSVVALYSPLCLKHCFSSCLFKTPHPEYKVSSDWSAHTSLSQHCQAAVLNQFLCAKLTARYKLCKCVRWCVM